MATKWLTIGIMLVVGGCSGDGGGGPIGPDPAATLTGLVQNTTTGAPIAGATVSVGTRSGTTGADGRFEISNAPVGEALAVSVTAAGYNAYNQTIAIRSGANTHNVSLARTTLFERSLFTLYVPATATSIRAVLFVLMGGTVDARPLLRGEFAYYDEFPLSGNVALHREHVMQFADQNDVAVLGTQLSVADATSPAKFAAVLTALQQYATSTGHPELANAPLLLQGHSNGACFALAFTKVHAERVIGFTAGKGVCAPFFDGGEARSVPALFFIGENDAPGLNLSVTSTFDLNRSQGAPWALTVEREAGHHQVVDKQIIFKWLATVLALRLPAATSPSTPVVLRPVDQNAGWLGNPVNLAIARYACYNGDKAKANWLPSEATARDWQAMTSDGSTAVVVGC